MEAYDMTPEQITEKVKNMVWSFSRVNSANKCRYAWYKEYVEEAEGYENCYAQFGSICHKTLEKFLKGELDVFSASQYYEDHYSEYVTCDFPANKYTDLAQKTYEQGLDYFNNLWFDFDKYEILGVEEELLFHVCEYPFKGYADAIYRDRETGEIILRDHKTSSFRYLKDGSVSKTNAEHFKEFRYQELLYCIPLIEKYGKVDYLSWNMIRDQREIKIPFNQAEYTEAQIWCINTIKDLEEEVLWLPDNSSSYWCNCICGSRGSCNYKKITG